ncbi:MAG: class I SAM-dependent methyltransferase [Bryobacteraceae bacterium]|nr:class I SAM-dependent methyltransferase [Bryobacteraceae bacterium]
MSEVNFKPLQEKHWQAGDPTGWFEPAYAQANGDRAAIPWAEKGINPHLAEWAERVNLAGTGRTALVIGCGLGDDAEYLASRGFAVTAFDISPTAIAWCQERFPGSTVQYVVADLFAHALPPADFVLEAHTLQALPRPYRASAVAAISASVQGQLLVICRGCDVPEPGETIPWPLTPEELAGFAAAGLLQTSFEDFEDDKQPPRRRFRIEYNRQSLAR